MRRIGLIAASFVAGAALSVFLLPVQASAVTIPVHQKATLSDGSVQLVRHRGFRGHAFRGGRHYGWRRHGWRRHGWRGAGWGLALGAMAGAPYYYGGYNCPLVRRTVWTPRGYRVRWVRRCW